MKSLLAAIKSQLPGKTLPSGAAAEKGYFLQGKFNAKTTEGKKSLLNIYKTQPLVHRAVSLRADLVLNGGFKVLVQSTRAKKVRDDFLRTFSKASPMLGLYNTLRSLVMDGDIFGNGYWEKKFVGARFHSIATIHPTNFDFVRTMDGKIVYDKKGNPVGYQQTFDDGRENIELKLEKIAHYMFSSTGDEPYGTGILEPLYYNSRRLISVEDALAEALVRHGSPLHDIAVGDETHHTTQKMIDNVVDETEGLSAKSVYVHGPWIKLKQSEAYSLVKTSGWTETFITNISACTGIPRFLLLGVGEGVNKAAMQGLLRLLPVTINTLRDALTEFLEEEIFRPLMETNNIKETVKIVWNTPITSDPTILMNLLPAIAEKEIAGKPLLSWRDAREIIGLPVITKTEEKTELKKKTNEKSEQ